MNHKALSTVAFLKAILVVSLISIRNAVQNAKTTLQEVILGLFELGIKKGRANLTLPRSLKMEY